MCNEDEGSPVPVAVECPPEADATLKIERVSERVQGSPSRRSRVPVASPANGIANKRSRESTPPLPLPIVVPYVSYFNTLEEFGYLILTYLLSM